MNARKDHVWIIDTAAATVVSDEEVFIETVRWIGGTTAGHVAEIANPAGDVVWASVADAANFVDESYLCNLRLISGFIVPTLVSGKLYIYLKTGR